MIEEVKKILIDRYSAEYAKVREEYNSRRKVIDSLEEKLEMLEWETQFPVIKKHFNFIQRTLTRRYEYQRYKEQEKEYNEHSKREAEIRVKLSTERPKIEQEIQELKLKEKMKIAEEKLENVKRAKVLKDIDLDLFEAIRVLEENGIPVVLTEADKVITEVGRNYTSKKSLIGVHKTEFAPTDSQIKTAKDAKACSRQKITINGQEYEYEVVSERNTVHMAMNDEVSSHLYGSWDDCKYAILIPMSDIPKEKIGYTSTVDTFTKGSLDLSSNSWILCPINEVEQIKEKNPNVYVIGYEGKSVFGYPAPFLSALGYRAEDVGMWSWQDEISTRQFHELMDKEGLQSGPHSYTYFAEDELTLTAINKIVAISNLLREKGALRSNDDISNTYEEFKNQSFCFPIPVMELCYSSQYDDGNYPEAIKGNHRHLDIFFNKMKENGFLISDTYKKIMKRIDRIGIGSINKDNLEEIFKGFDDVADTEHTVLTEFRTSLGEIDYWALNSDKVTESISKFITIVVFDSVVKSNERSLKNESIANIESELDI